MTIDLLIIIGMGIAGAMLGVLAMSLCAMAALSDERSEREGRR